MERDEKSLNLDSTAKHMEEYVKAGLTTFDMADHYGSAELISGIYNQNYSSSGEVQLLTKWVPEPGPCSKKDVYAAINRSLDRMKTESLDLLQYHAWNYADPSWLDALFHLQELKEDGLIKNIGVTNLDTAHFRIALTSGIDIVSNQVCYSLLDRRAKYGMTELCREFGVKILAYGTLAKVYKSSRRMG
jgi:aryl-alcohol dehydrogenase-like predicted oxidoreductase